MQTDTAKELSNEEELSFIETSALEAHNVEAAFNNVLKEIFENVRKRKMAEAEAAPEQNVKAGTTIEVKADTPAAKKKSGCC